MELFENSANVTGAFPNAASNNITVSGDGTGTPFEKNWLNNIWGGFQKVLDLAGLTPDGSIETGSGSQFVDALKLSFGYPGEIVPLHVFVDPATLSPAPRLILLEGQGVLRTNYTALDAAVYVGDSNNATYPAYYHADDSAGTSRNTAGIYLILPDMRGYTLRGLDVAAAIDPDGATRKLADTQAAEVESHQHSVTSGQPVVVGSGTYAGSFLEPLQINAVAGGGAVVAEIGGSQSVPVVDTVGDPTGSYGGNETRMANTSCRFAVRY